MSSFFDSKRFASKRHQPWRAPRWLFLFRCLILVSLIWVFLATPLAPTHNNTTVQFTWLILGIYSIFIIINGINLILCWSPQLQQVQIAIFIDIIAYTLLMHAAGGITSGLGVLLAVAVASAAFMMEGRLSLLFAAIASLAVIAQQSYSVLIDAQTPTNFTQAGLLGLLFFTVAVMSHVLYRRVKSAEALAARRKVDIDDLSKLNDFIIHSINTGILVIDGTYRLRFFNRAALELFNVNRLRIGAPLASLSRELNGWLHSAINDQKRELQNTELDQASKKSGQSALFLDENLLCFNNRDIRISLKLLGEDQTSGIILYLRDNQEVVNEAQQIKLAALGTLTASIAHNIRNPLSAVIHAGELLAESTTLNEDDHHLLDIIRRNGGRIEETVQSVLQLSRRHQHQPTQFSLFSWIEEFVTEFREQHHLTVDHIQLQMQVLAPTVVTVDSRHLHQILANLCENALIHGSTERDAVQFSLQVCHSHDPHALKIAVCDTGPGIAPEIANDIFNPFYTTTANGTGLGLYIARELAEMNNIHLTYYPSLPHGSCFCLFFRN